MHQTSPPTPGSPCSLHHHAQSLSQLTQSNRSVSPTIFTDQQPPAARSPYPASFAVVGITPVTLASQAVRHHASGQPAPEITQTAICSLQPGVLDSGIPPPAYPTASLNTTALADDAVSADRKRQRPESDADIGLNQVSLTTCSCTSNCCHSSTHGCAHVLRPGPPTNQAFKYQLVYLLFIRVSKYQTGTCHAQ